MRLWTRRAIDEVIAAIRDLQKTLVDLGVRSGDIIIPGYTHLQRAQPVYVAHHLLAYVEMLQRDAGRFAMHARAQMSVRWAAVRLQAPRFL